jgi:hypothetical protein
MPRYRDRGSYRATVRDIEQQINGSRGQQTIGDERQTEAARDGLAAGRTAQAADGADGKAPPTSAGL